MFSSSFVVRMAYAASLCAQLQGAHVHGHGHVVPRARRAEWKRSGTDRAGWQRAVGPVLHTATLAAATRFHHRQGRDELTLVTDERRRTNGRNGTRDRDERSGRGRAGGLERTEVVGALRHAPPLCPVQSSLPSATPLVNVDIVLLDQVLDGADAAEPRYLVEGSPPTPFGSNPYSSTK